jgi:ribonuclease HII
VFSIISEKEYQRLEKMSVYENDLRKEGFELIAGVDEAGRGPWAGPVVAAACILKDGVKIPFLDDSKKLTPVKRKEVYLSLIKNPKVFYAVGIEDEKTIDKINILQATFLAMQKAVSSLPAAPDFILVDGHMQPDFHILTKCLIGGDSLSVSIAAASIIAKNVRDEIMIAYHEKWPMYNFKDHKGYGTEKHKKALELYGPCEIHRRSFEPIKSMTMRRS